MTDYENLAARLDHCAPFPAETRKLMRSAAALLRAKVEKGKIPGESSCVWIWSQRGAMFERNILPAAVYELLPTPSDGYRYGNRHRAFLRLARALRECEKKVGV